MKSLSFFLILVFFVPAAFAGKDKIDGNDLKYLLSPAESEHARHKNDLNANEMHLLIQKGRGQTVGKDGDPRHGGRVERDKDAAWPGAVPAGSEDSDSSKLGPDPGSSGAVSPEDASGWPTAAGKATSADGGTGAASSASGDSADRKSSSARRSARRVPPAWGTLNKGGARRVDILSDDLESAQGPLFGIRRGSEIRATLSRATTNVAPGLAEFVTTSDFFGDHRDLPAGTKIFLNKAVANGSNRLYFTASGALNGITPEGDEFSIVCSVTDVSMNKQLGLVGAITTDKKIIQRSMASGAFAAGQSLLNNSLAGGVAGDAVAAAADSALTEKESETSAALREPTFVILVSPQDVYIRVDKSF